MMKASPAQEADQSAVRTYLNHLIQQCGATYAELSRLIGRNPTYLQQFIHRGVPKKLSEDDRLKLAAYFGVSQESLGKPSTPAVEVFAITASEIQPEEPHNPPSPCNYDTNAAASQIKATAGNFILPPTLMKNGQFVSPNPKAGRVLQAQIVFRLGWMRSLASQSPEAMAVFHITESTMAPTLPIGTRILVDTADQRPGEGVFLLKSANLVLVRRIVADPGSDSMKICCDNPDYPSGQTLPPTCITIIGRVVWASVTLSTQGDQQCRPAVRRNLPCP